MKNRLNGKKIMNRIAGKLVGLFGALLVLCLLVVTASPVLALPGIPHRFYGSATINGAQAPTGTVITARITGAPDATTTVDASGNYDFNVPADDPDVAGKQGGVNGDTVQFLVDTTVAQTGTFASGSITPLDLSVTTTPPTVVTNDATNVTTSSADLNGDLTAMGDATTVACSFVYGTTQGGPYPNETTPAEDKTAIGTFTINLTGLNSNTPYYYQAKGVGSTVYGAEKAFTTGAGVVGKLIGMDDATLVTNASPSYFVLDKFTAVATGNLTQFKLKCGAIGNVKTALYADNAGQPGDLIAANNTSTAVIVGWNTIGFPSTTITSGTTYWLAFNSDVFCVGWVSSDGLTVAYRVESYDSFFFPPSAGTGFSSNYITPLIAGWGTIVTPEPPTRDCSTLTFRWNASTGATKYHLQVNTSADFTGTDMFNGEVGDVTSYEVTGLSADTTYYYRIKAGNAAGWSGWSSTGSMRCGGVT